MPLESDLVDGEPWVFDGDVAANFDEMLSRSIPEYERMREAVYAVASRFRVERDDERLPWVVDLGCSRGEAIAKLVDDGWAATGFEVSKPMVDAARARFADSPSVLIVEHDLREPLNFRSDVDVVLAVLTLMFVPTNHRHRVLRDAFRALRPGGALLVVEKVLGRGELDEVFVDAYHSLKSAHGYSVDEIRRKALALEGVLVPVTAEANEALLRDAGFVVVECFWRWLNFAAWVAVKPTG